MANYANLISIMSQHQEINFYKIPSHSYIFELISALFAYILRKKIYYYRITQNRQLSRQNDIFKLNFKINYAETCLVNLFCRLLLKGYSFPFQ